MAAAGPVGHSANLNFLRNNASGLKIPPKKPYEVLIPQPEPAPIPVECNIHAWMKAYDIVLEHPYVGVSNEDGELIIKNLSVFFARQTTEVARAAVQALHRLGSRFGAEWPRGVRMAADRLRSTLPRL